jgi:glycine/D-amino acid oxidase-like deaminating enzyme
MSAGLVDLLVVGGGINGVGIARDAAGRGLSVVLCEKDETRATGFGWSRAAISWCRSSGTGRRPICFRMTIVG